MIITRSLRVGKEDVQEVGIEKLRDDGERDILARGRCWGCGNHPGAGGGEGKGRSIGGSALWVYKAGGC